MNDTDNRNMRSGTAALKKSRAQVILKELKELRMRLKNSEETIRKVKSETSDLRISRRSFNAATTN